MFNYNTVCVLVVCLLIINNALAESQYRDNSDKLGEYLYNKCYNQTYDLAVFNKLRDDSIAFGAEFESAISSLPSEEKPFCDHTRYRLERKVSVIAKDLEPCLRPNEKYLSDFMVRSFKEATHFLCHNHGRNIRSLLGQHGKECRKNLGTLADKNNCFGKIFKPLHGTLSKKELCDDLGVAEKCFAATLDEKCPTFREYKDLNQKFFRYITKPCRDSGSIFQINTLLLLLPILMSYLFSKN